MPKDKDVNSYQKNREIRGHEAKTVRKIVTIIILSLLLIFTVGGISSYMYIKSTLEPVDPSNEEEIKVTIPMGSSTSTIAKILEDEGVIKDARVFRFYIKFKNQSDFQAGDYALSKALSLDEIIESLKSGKVEEEAVYTVTVPEGKTIEDIAEIYADKLSFSEKDFLDKVNDQKYIEELIEKYPTLLSDEILDDDIRTPLEGYLFAATYDFYEEDPTIESVVEVMLGKTLDIVNKYTAKIEEKDLTIHEAVTFASLIENEERTEEERKRISGVFYNRLDEKMMLQTDPTVAYAQGKHLKDVLLKDLEIESPYNTYKIPALPIGPISNFAENALEATVDPEEVDFLYFLHDNDGKIHYAKTYDEHLALKKKYLD